MSWADVGQIALAAITSAGGIGAILLGAVKFSSHMIAERLSQKYSVELNESIEKLKAQLDNGNHISRAVFDKEFEYYQRISKAVTVALYNFDLYYGLIISDIKVIPIRELNIYNPKLESIAMDVNMGKSITEKQLNTVRDSMLEQLLEVKKLLNESAPFIDRSILLQYDELYNYVYLYYMNKDKQYYEKIMDLRIEVQRTVRNYLTSLTVVN